MLGALVLALDDRVGRKVGDSHCRIRHVDVLAAGPAGAKGVDAQVFRADVNLDLVVDLRIHVDRGEGRVPTRVGVERGDADQSVHTDF